MKIPFHKIYKQYVSDELKNYQDDKLLLLAGFGVTDRWSISQYKQLWTKYDKSNKAVGRDEKNTKKVDPDEAGGAITLIDPQLELPTGYKVLAERDITTPMGLLVYPATRELLVGSSRGIQIIKSGKVQRALRHNLLSSVHGMDLNGSGIYAACAATDSILEIDPTSNIVKWRWTSSEHGLIFLLGVSW